ncbi:hypothetical protein ACFOTA_23550 [Chitinophaga sp. GCM10012297]|uniref:DUF2178 domain-containing protein n=1 Tax=Chitinophaga chungangae TaxID=2821488 RepID=A0ABS3YKJ8_9BACT|nr:hypothetical protein [Chitinophaga chungangae]MBO9155205.1 hypothetical protein [Chitinophaga chungangae]
MKKTFVLMVTVLTPAALFAENFRLADNREFSAQLLTIPAMLIMLYLVCAFVLYIVKAVLEHRLRSKMVDKGVSEKVAEQFLQPVNRDLRSQALKWCLMLAGAGLGFLVVYYTLPLDIHSLAIMAFSIALSYLAYFLYLRYNERP